LQNMSDFNNFKTYKCFKFIKIQCWILNCVGKLRKEKQWFKCRCLVPECENSGNTTFEPPWVNASAPKIDGVISGCARYTVRDDRPGICTETSFTNVTCDCDSWIYDPEEHTILNEVMWPSVISAYFSLVEI